MQKRLNLTQLSVEHGIVASTTQTQGKQILTHNVNEIGTCANTNNVVTLPDGIPGLEVVVVNNGAQTLQIYPFSGQNLGGGTNTSTTLATTKSALFVCYKAGFWAKFTN